MSTARIFTVDDANPEALSGKKIAVMGFGSQGGAQLLGEVDRPLVNISGTTMKYLSGSSALPGPMNGAFA